MSRRALVATGMLVAGGFLLLQAAWMLTMPRATGIDEFDHVYRAASVATGDWGFSHQKVDHDQGRGERVAVPREIVAATHDACARLQYTGPANCSANADAGHGLVLVACAASRYNPLYYALIGYPGSLFHGAAALAAMRVISALLCAAMLALGAVALRSWARTGWPVLCLFVAATPTVVYSSSLASPNGLNIVSGLTLWAALLGLLLGSDETTTRRRLLVIAAVSAVTLVNTHTLGVVWLVLIVAAVAIQRGRLRPPTVPLALRRATWTTTMAVALGTVVAVGWVLAARTNNPAADGGPLITVPWWHLTFTVGVPLWPLQAIAAFPLRDQPAPLAVYALGIALMCSLAAAAVVGLVRRRSWSALAAIGFVVFMSYAVPIVLTALSFRHIGLAWQGRYEMPLTGGLLLLYGVALDRSPRRLPAPLVAGVMIALASMNLLSQLHVAGMFDGSAMATATGWHRPSTLWLVVLALGYAAGAFVSTTRRSRSADLDTPVSHAQAGDPRPVEHRRAQPVTT